MDIQYFYPKQFDLGWIFYNEENKGDDYLPLGDGESVKENYWEQVRKDGVAEGAATLFEIANAFSGSELRQKLSDYAEALQKMSEKERIKENKTMQELYQQNIDSDSGIHFLRHFNEIVLGQDKFKAILERVIKAIELGGTNRAPSQAVNFTGYFISSMNTELSKHSIIEMTEYSDAEWIQKILQPATDEALEKMLEAFNPTKEIFGSASDYEGLINYLKGNPAFYQFVESYLKFDQIRAKVEKLRQAGHKRKMKITINDVFKSKKTGEKPENFDRMIGGFVEEFLGEGNIRVTLDKTGSVVSMGNIFKARKGATDTITVATRNYEVDVGKVYDKIQETEWADTQKDMAFQFNKIYRELDRKKYSDVFVIHSSDKLYSMGDSFDGFHKTQKITDIQVLLDQSGMSGARLGHELVSLYLNTVPGAAFSDNKDVNTIEEILRVVVAAVAGKLLFSDWMMIGYVTGGPTQIHVFDLDGTLIPLSYVLEGLAEAMKKFGETGIYKGPITISGFSRAKEILYPRKKDGSSRYGLVDGESMIDFNEYWKEQREDAREKASFRITFMNDFKGIIQEIKATFG